MPAAVLAELRPSSLELCIHRGKGHPYPLVRGSLSRQLAAGSVLAPAAETALFAQGCGRNEPLRGLPTVELNAAPCLDRVKAPDGLILALRRWRINSIASSGDILGRGT